MRREIQHPFFDSMYVAYLATQHRMLMSLRLALSVAGIFFEMQFEIMRDLLHEHPLRLVLECNAVFEEPEDELHAALVRAVPFAVVLEGVVWREGGRNIQLTLQLHTLILFELSDEGHALLHRLLNGVDGTADALLENFHARAMQRTQVLTLLHHLLKLPPRLEIPVVGQ